MFVHYFVRLRTNHYTLLTISRILFIFDSARNLMRNLPYHLLWYFVKILITWRKGQNVRWEKWLARWFTKCHLYTFRFSHFAKIFSRSHQFDDKCIALLGHQERRVSLLWNANIDKFICLFFVSRNDGGICGLFLWRVPTKVRFFSRSFCTAEMDVNQ